MRLEISKQTIRIYQGVLWKIIRLNSERPLHLSHLMLKQFCLKQQEILWFYTERANYVDDSILVEIKDSKGEHVATSI